jgi:hypothetical protein
MGYMRYGAAMIQFMVDVVRRVGESHNAANASA